MKRSATLPALALALALALAVAAGCSSPTQQQTSVANSDTTLRPSSQASDLTGMSFEVFRDPG